MTSEPRDLARKWHRMQKDSGSCVAACRAIVDAYLGGEGVEEPCDPAHAGERKNPSDPGDIELIEVHVQRYGPAIVTVHPGPWMDLARLEKRRSPYGDLGEQLHAIVIAYFDTKTKFFVALDPYFRKKFQPVSVSRDNFATAWSGQVEFV